MSRCPGPGRCGRPRSSPASPAAAPAWSIVMNHVLADGIGGLAVLASLVDESPGLPPPGPAAVPFPAPAPGAGTLAADAWAGRARRLAHPAGSVRTIRQGLAELGGARPPPPAAPDIPEPPHRAPAAAGCDHRRSRGGPRPGP